jgi:type IV secretion system protein VirB10
MPNGRSIVLERQPGADTQGFAGLEDEVDHHWGRLLTAAALSTVLGVSAELGSANNDSAIVTALRRGSTDSLNQTGQQVVRRNLNMRSETDGLESPQSWDFEVFDIGIVMHPTAD